jgi:hypothetical protein
MKILKVLAIAFIIAISSIFISTQCSASVSLRSTEHDLNIPQNQLTKLQKQALYLMNSKDYNNANYCTQPPKGGQVDNYMQAPLMKKYGSQRIFFEGLSQDHYYASALAEISSLDILFKNTPLDQWHCGNYRLVVFNATWFDPSSQEYKQEQKIGIAKIDFDNSKAFSLANVLFAKDWAAKWTQNNKTGSFTLTNNNDVDISISNIELTPQGTDADQSKYGPGFVPTNDTVNAYSFSSLGSQISGQIGDLKFDDDGSVAYVESVITTESPSISGNFACVYLLQTDQNKGSLFVCGTADGSYSKAARGMVISNKNGDITRTWLRPGEFTLKPIGDKYPSKNAETSFYKAYQLRVPSKNIDIKVKSLPSQDNIDFGAKSGPLARWTQEVAVKNATTSWQNTRGMLDISVVID